MNRRNGQLQLTSPLAITTCRHPNATLGKQATVPDVGLENRLFSEHPVMAKCLDSPDEVRSGGQD